MRRRAPVPDEGLHGGASAVLARVEVDGPKATRVRHLRLPATARAATGNRGSIQPNEYEDNVLLASFCIMYSIRIVQTHTLDHR